MPSKSMTAFQKGRARTLREQVIMQAAAKILAKDHKDNEEAIKASELINKLYE